MSGSIGFATEMSVCVRRRNPVRIPRRDVLVQASDTPVLAMTIYQRDTDTAPLDISDAFFVISLYRERDERGFHGHWDYGAFWWHNRPHTVIRFPGTIIDPTKGRVDFSPVAQPHRWVSGRFWFELTMSYGFDPTTGIGVIPDPPALVEPNYSQGNMTILSGVMELVPGARIALFQLPELLGGIGIEGGAQLDGFILDENSLT